MKSKLPNIPHNNSLTHIYTWVDFIKNNHNKTTLLINTYKNLGKDKIEKYPYPIDFTLDGYEEFQPFVVAVMIVNSEYKLKKLIDTIFMDDNTKALVFFLENYKASLHYLNPIWIEKNQNHVDFWRIFVKYLSDYNYIGTKPWMYFMNTYQESIFNDIKKAIILDDYETLFFNCIYHKVSFNNQTLYNIIDDKHIKQVESLYNILVDIVDNGVKKNRILDYEIPVVFKNTVNKFRSRLLGDHSFMLYYSVN